MCPQDSAVTTAAASRWWKATGKAALLLRLSTAVAQPQQPAVHATPIDTTAYTVVEKMPEPPGGGGLVGLVTLLHQRIRFPLFCGQYPEKSRVLVEFIVTKTGEVRNVRIRQSIDARVDTAVVEAVRSLPRLTPGYPHGRPVAVRLTVPLQFHWQ